MTLCVKRIPYEIFGAYRGGPGALKLVCRSVEQFFEPMVPAWESVVITSESMAFVSFVSPDVARRAAEIFHANQQRNPRSNYRGVLVDYAYNMRHIHEKTLWKTHDRLMRLVVRGRLDLVMAVLGVPGCRIDSSDIGGYRPIHKAAASGHALIVVHLLSCGAELNCLSRAGETPRDLASCYGHSQVELILKQRGGDCNLKGRKYNTKWVAAALAEGLNCAHVGGRGGGDSGDVTMY
eukprot:TRINITY_DN2415_c0_g1_i1.p1 TRINITY_DN2415_c0_g1~~TRINITY_DN2415_c0_g1_i1.p1  ORF type:complete len:236 (-),score=18.70 TRINITY_DN2415_c0_g1_i1:134-841(-)